MAALNRAQQRALAPLLLVFSVLILADTAPFELTWSNQSYGPDGPWPAVQISFGSNDGSISLFPGGYYETYVIEDNYCHLNNSDVCYAAKAGTYDYAQSVLAGAGFPGDELFLANVGGMAMGLDLVGAQTDRWIDDLLLGITSDTPVAVPNTTMVIVDSDWVAYPGGQWYPLSVGCLSLGATDSVVQMFELPSGTQVNASLPPGSLWEQGLTPSNSFGMHIGSVAPGSPKIPGSLWYGGYDKARVTGDVLAFDATKGDFRYGASLHVTDIALEVIDGYSPFNFTNKQDGLLAKGNSTIGSSLIVSVDGCSPYFTLPQSTCSNIASYLPVKYDKDFGLYLWDTTSNKYEEIISSASALSFSFAGESKNETLTIRIPFKHLNLTLSAPLTDTPTSYFPCYNSGLDDYTLGRAFLQDAFLGANWNSQSQTWWLAQATGPNIGKSQVQALQETDKTIEAGGNDWKTSWENVWSTDAPATPSHNSTAEPAETSKPPPSSSSKSGLSTGATAGIAVGAAVVGLAAIGAAWFFWRRKRTSPTSYEVQPVVQELQTDFSPEVPKTAQDGVVYDNTLYEMPVGSRDGERTELP